MGGRGAGGADPRISLEGAMKQMLVQGLSLRLLGEAENQDSQHMLNRHRGSFPDALEPAKHLALKTVSTIIKEIRVVVPDL